MGALRKLLEMHFVISISISHCCESTTFLRGRICLQCFDTVGWALETASSL